MNVLCIGNSFGSDSTHYLHGIAASAGRGITVVNLYIGGCPLSKHYRNMLSEERAYAMEFNGQSTGFYVSLKEALLSREWDAVILHQASPVSVNYDTYQPYLNELAAYVKKLSPKAKIVIQETWEYEKDSNKLASIAYTDPTAMYNDLHDAYQKAAKDVGADKVIPSGTMFHELIGKGFAVHRDSLHASYGMGRYALALLWFHVLTGKDVTDNTFNAFDAEVSPEEIEAVKKCVMQF